MPILNIRIARPAVKYLVVSQAKADGSLRAHNVKTTVQTGNKLVNAPETFVYVSNHVSSVSSMAVAAACATTSARGCFVAWRATPDLRS